jgi:hypothetical protein
MIRAKEAGWDSSLAEEHARLPSSVKEMKQLREQGGNR